jgi:hypothetical protein
MSVSTTSGDGIHQTLTPRGVGMDYGPIVSQARHKYVIPVISLNSSSHYHILYYLQVSFIGNSIV